MFDGKVTFRSRFPSVEFSAIEFTPPSHLNSRRATITSHPGDGVILTAEIKDAASVEDGIAAAQAVAGYVRETLSFHMEKHLESFTTVEYSFTEQGVDGQAEHVGHGFSLTDRADGWVAIGPDNCKKIETYLEQSAHPGKLYYDQFNSALGMSDPISRFMCLYNIILSLSGDQQEGVDKFVLSEEPSVPVYTPHNPRKSGIPETEYSRLRNQIGHHRQGTYFDTTRREMSDRLTNLIQLT